MSDCGTCNGNGFIFAVDNGRPINLPCPNPLCLGGQVPDQLPDRDNPN